MDHPSSFAAANEAKNHWGSAKRAINAVHLIIIFHVRPAPNPALLQFFFVVDLNKNVI